MGLESVPAGKALPDDIYVVIEIPANSDWEQRSSRFDRFFKGDYKPFTGI